MGDPPSFDSTGDTIVRPITPNDAYYPWDFIGTKFQ